VIGVNGPCMTIADHRVNTAAPSCTKDRCSCKICFNSKVKPGKSERGEDCPVRCRVQEFHDWLHSVGSSNFFALFLESSVCVETLPLLGNAIHVLYCFDEILHSKLVVHSLKSYKMENNGC